MKIAEILKAAAELIGDEAANAVTGYVEEGQEGGESLTDELLRCYNLVEKELASEYLPLKTEETIETDTGVFPYTALQKRALKIVKVSDEWGVPLRVTMFADYCKAQVGKLVVSYTYEPTEKTLEEDAETHYAVSKRLLTYGVAANYCLACGLYEEAAVWENKYKSAIGVAYGHAPCKKVRGRTWR